MSAARARRRLMAHERSWRRGLLLKAPSVQWVAVTPGHCRAFERVAHAMRNRWGWPWVLNPPHRKQRSS